MRSTPKVDQRRRRRFDDDPLDLVDADLAGDCITITLPCPQANALARAARFSILLLGPIPALDAGLSKLAVAVGEPDRLGPLHHRPVVDRFDASLGEGRR
jgi:hypothetical protein